MPSKNFKNKKHNKPDDFQRRQRAAQLLFALLAVILIISMVLSAVTTY
jgi:hypothetical protein